MSIIERGCACPAPKRAGATSQQLNLHSAHVVGAGRIAAHLERKVQAEIKGVRVLVVSAQVIAPLVSSSAVATRACRSLASVAAVALSAALFPGTPRQKTETSMLNIRADRGKRTDPPAPPTEAPPLESVLATLPCTETLLASWAAPPFAPAAV